MKQKIFLCIFLSLILVLAGGCAINAKKKVKIGIRVDVPNLGFGINSSDGIYGYEVDFAKELAKRLGYSNVELVVLDANTRESAIDQGLVDMVIACYSYSDKRAQKYDISKPYYEDEMLFAAKFSSMFTQISDLKNATIGIYDSDAVMESLAETMLNNNIKEYNVERFDNYELLANYLNSGIVDVVYIDGCMFSSYYLTDTGCLAGETSTASYGVLLRKNSGMLDEINSIIDELNEEGYFEMLVDKWGSAEELYEFE